MWNPEVWRRKSFIKRVKPALLKVTDHVKKNVIPPSGWRKQVETKTVF